MDIFEQIAITSESIKKLVKRKHMIFKRYQLNVKDIKCPLQWWHKHEVMFPTVGFLTQQILGIIGSQIEKNLSLVRILTNHKRCRLQMENLEKLIFVNKNWPNDLKIRCKSASNLLKFLKRDMNLEEELEEFEGEFEI